METIRTYRPKGFTDPKYSAARSMYEGGLSIGAVAEHYGITRQAMYDILKQRGTQFRPQRRVGPENTFYRGGKTCIKKVHLAVERAIERGILKKQPCEVCSNPKASAHHDDYAKPLDVRWLCRKHHFEWHCHNTPKNGLLNA